MRCDVIADGVVSAVKEVGLTKPLVVRPFGWGRTAELGSCFDGRPVLAVDAVER